jgi:hypothetical protein
MSNEAERQARAHIPASTLREMEQAAPYDARADLRAYGFAHSPCSPIPQDKADPIRPSTNIGECSAERLLVNPNNPQHPTPGVDLLDRQMAAEANREAKALASPSATEKMLEVAQAVMKQQAEIMKLVAEQKK